MNFMDSFENVINFIYPKAIALAFLTIGVSMMYVSVKFIFSYIRMMFAFM